MISGQVILRVVRDDLM